MVFTWFILQKERSCLLLNDFMFPCCFYVFLNNFFVLYGWMLRRMGVKFLTSNQHTKHTWHNEFGWLPQQQKQFMDNLLKFCLSRNRPYPKFAVLVHFWLGQIYPKAHKILLKVKIFQKTTPQEYQLTQSQVPGFSSNHVPLFFIISTHN